LSLTSVKILFTAPKCCVHFFSILKLKKPVHTNTISFVHMLDLDSYTRADEQRLYSNITIIKSLLERLIKGNVLNVLSVDSAHPKNKELPNYTVTDNLVCIYIPYMVR